MKEPMEQDYLKNLEEQIKRLKLIQYLRSAMNTTKSSEELLEIMLDQSIELTGATSGSIMLKDETSERLYIVLSRNLDQAEIAKYEFKVGVGVTGVVFQEGIPKLVNDIQLEPKYIPLRGDIQSELAVPLYINGKIKGVINVDSIHRNAFSEYDV